MFSAWTFNMGSFTESFKSSITTRITQNIITFFIKMYFSYIFMFLNYISLTPKNKMNLILFLHVPLI